MNKLDLKAKNTRGMIHTAEIEGPRYRTNAKDLETGAGSELHSYNTPGEAVIHHFYLCAKYNLTPYRD